ALPDEIMPRRHGVFVRCRKRMLWRKPMAHGQRAHACRPAGFGHQAAMAGNRARTIASTMEKEEDARGIAARRQRKLGLEPSEINGLKTNIMGDRPHRADFVQSLSPLRPPHRPWF